MQQQAYIIVDKPLKTSKMYTQHARITQNWGKMKGNKKIWKFSRPIPKKKKIKKGKSEPNKTKEMNRKDKPKLVMDNKFYVSIVKPMQSSNEERKKHFIFHLDSTIPERDPKYSTVKLSMMMKCECECESEWKMRKLRIFLFSYWMRNHVQSSEYSQI